MSNGQLAGGSIIYMSATAPATYTKAGYEAITWVAIGEVTDVNGEIGATHSVQTYSVLSSRGVTKRLGQYDNGTPTLMYKYHRTDAGQADVVGQVGVNAPSAFKIAMSDADTTQVYFMALIPKAPVEIGNADGFIQSSVDLAIDSVSDVLFEAAPI